MNCLIQCVFIYCRRATIANYEVLSFDSFFEVFHIFVTKLPSWLVDGNRISTKIKSASSNHDLERINWKSYPARACPNCEFVIDNNEEFWDSSCNKVIEYTIEVSFKGLY
ncbi:uncharacterized protein LOC133801213 [Humulus lupulus]|uniref:uncharacterized protein LOC133801213 n=1 Tax=Humulus lupulus TaxID=3486 RepID=UPI002B416345|nr:uncharacterized protein LOC133801213 [Humulus lupulus]